MSLKFSLRDLLILIAVISVACAALANTGIWWHSFVVTATLTGMTGLLLWGVLNDGARRSFVCGWLLFTVGYLSLVFGPWTGNHLGIDLITSKGLSALELKTRGDNPSPPVMHGRQQMEYDQVLPPNWGRNLYPSWTVYPPSSVWSFTEPNWADSYTTFQSTGHWLLASVFGYCGGYLAIFLYHCRPPVPPGANRS